MDLWIGAGLGFLMFWAKVGSFWLLTGGSNQWNMPFTGVGARDWWYGGPVRKGLIDIFVGYLGTHLFNGNNVGMIALGTYMITCMIWIVVPIMCKKVKRKTIAALNSLNLGPFYK